uniref:Glutamate receptor 1 n=1 Tax=Anopheles coluzzii TaxID=1518534 RepID=A0A8W7Q0Q4_ANOCL
MQCLGRVMGFNFLSVILLLVHILCGYVDGKREIPVGAIFHQVPDHSYESEIAFRYAIERVNMHEKHFELVPIVRYVSPDDSYKTEHRILELLRQAKEVKMLEEYQSYIITSLDAHTIDFEELRYSRSNITALRLMDTKSFDIKNAVHDWEQGEARMKRQFRVSPEHVHTESALYNDAVKIYATAIRELDATEEITPSKLSCGSKNLRQWPFGLRIINYMKVKTEHGITGPIIFDDFGRRAHFHLDIIELSKDEGFKKIATWDPTHGVNYTRSQGEVYSQIVESLQNKTFIVASRIGAPFLMFKEKKDGEFLEGNNRFEGYSLELIDGISKILGFQYRMELVPDGKYGSYNKVTKKWDGLVKHLLDRKADLAVCDLTITYERRTAVDFTMPFMTLGISILYAKPVQQPKDLFSFLSPLSLDVWIYTATAYLGVSVLLFVLSRMAPADWENPHPCKQDNDEVENIWDMLNALWLTMGSIMGQGCDILPKAISTRLVAGMWWFFALIMLSSYTANLAAFLTMERMDATIESAEDLAKQSKIKYGVLMGGSTMAFFQTSNFSTYQRMCASMESVRPAVFSKSNDEGRNCVFEGQRMYAFLMESTSLEYITERYLHNTLSESTASDKSSLRSKSESRRGSELTGRGNNVRTATSLNNLNKIGFVFDKH